jgi:hypothetical protein
MRWKEHSDRAATMEIRDRTAFVVLQQLRTGLIYQSKIKLEKKKAAFSFCLLRENSN